MSDKNIDKDIEEKIILLKDFIEGNFKQDKIEHYKGSYKMGFFYYSDIKDAIENVLSEFQSLREFSTETVRRNAELKVELEIYIKKVDILENKVHYKICENCNKEYRTKRSDTKYCKECAKKVNNSNWYSSLTDKKKQERREKSKLAMRKYRARNEVLKDE